jgi:hypothetical protein
VQPILSIEAEQLDRPACMQVTERAERVACRANGDVKAFLSPSLACTVDAADADGPVSISQELLQTGTVVAKSSKAGHRLGGATSALEHFDNPQDSKESFSSMQSGQAQHTARVATLFVRSSHGRISIQARSWKQMIEQRMAAARVA